MLWKIWQKGKSNSDKIWTIWKKGKWQKVKLNSEMIWKIWKKSKWKTYGKYGGNASSNVK